MRLPPGYGNISKLSGRRRRPYMIRKNGKVLGYSRTRKEALSMLEEFNKDPWDVEKATFKDVYEIMVKYKSDSIGPKVMKEYASKYKVYCKSLYDMPYADLRLHHFTELLDSFDVANGTKNNIRKFFRAMDKVAYEYDIIQKQYTEMIPSYKVDFTERIPFSEKEIQTLWNNVDTIEDVDLVLILIYTGFRSGEFADLKLENIHDGFIIGGAKTKAGKNRKVPIHKKIKPLLQKRIEAARSETLLNYGSRALRVRFKKVMEKLNMNHIPHECRHTLRTRLDNLNISSVIIDLILGHKSQGIGERVYTHKTLDQLTEAINQLD